jgi:hypothetical protein
MKGMAAFLILVFLGVVSLLGLLFGGHPRNR